MTVEQFLLDTWLGWAVFGTVAGLYLIVITKLAGKARDELQKIRQKRDK